MDCLLCIQGWGRIELTYIFWWEISCVQVFEGDGRKTLSELEVDGFSADSQQN